jgi:uncharacterized protein YkwD
LAAGVVVALVLTLGSGTASSTPVAAGGAAAAHGATSPSPDIEAQFVSRINSLRSSKGLSQLRVHSQLLSVARNWTERMVQAGQISHNPNLSSEVSGNWTKLGENVGVGPSVDSLMQAFQNSPAHNRNLVDPDWNYVAVGVTLAADGQIYTTHNFMVMPESAPPPPPPPATTTPPPPPSSPTTRPPSAGGAPETTAGPVAATTTTTGPPPERPPSTERVTAMLDPLRSLERG